MRRWVLIGLLLVATIANAATITAAKAGNWSDTSVWNGGAVPGNGDTADLNNYAIVMDITRIPASGSLLGITDNSTSATGCLTVALDTLGSSEIYVNYSGATGIVATKNTTGLIQVTGTTSNTLKITGNLTGGSANASSAVYHNSTGALTIIGDIAATGGIHNALYVLTAATVSITGNITGGTNSGSRGARFDSTSTVTINGSVTGGSGSSAMGVYNASTGTVSVTGDITGGTGTSQAHGLYTSVGGAITLASCNLINGTGCVAYAGRTPTWKNDGSNYLQWAITEGTAKFGREPAAGKLYTGIVCGDVTGTLTLPSANVVTEGTSFGAGGTEYSGNYHEPLPVEVLSTASFGSNSGVNGTYHAPETSEVVDTATFGAPPAAPGLVHLPEAAEVIDTAKFGVSSGTPGTYHEAETGEVQAGVMFGPASAYTGTYDPTADDVWPLATNVWHDTGAYGPTGADYTPEMVGSDIVNLEAGNIKDGVTIDDVEGTYAGGGGGVGAAFNKGVN